MTFDWSQYLHLAKETLGQPAPPADRESRYRSAIHLAYYAAFISARNYLRDKKGYTFSTTVNIHKKVRDRFRISSDPIYKEIGKKLNILRLDRNQADYTDFVPNLNRKSKRAVKRSQQIILQLNKL